MQDQNVRAILHVTINNINCTRDNQDARGYSYDRYLDWFPSPFGGVDTPTTCIVYMYMYSTC